MRDLFPEYYPLSDDQVKDCVTGGLIVLDTNVLLSLYRFSTSERDGLLDLLERVQERLWIPYQVAAEFQRNREAVVAQQAGFYDSVVSLVSGPNAGEVKKRLTGLTLPDEVRPTVEALVDDYLTAMKTAAGDFVTKAEAIRTEHVVTREQARTDDPVRSRLDQFFQDRVGTAPTPETREARVKEALVRYADEIPPGYKDQDKDTDERKAGDYLLWAELLEYTAGLIGEDSVLFVTSDTKADWFRKDGQPLEALRREFADHSPATYHQVSLSDFLTLANQHLSATVPTDTIERAHTIQLSGVLPRKAMRHTFQVPLSDVSRRLAADWLAQARPKDNPEVDRLAEAFRAMAARNGPLLTPEQIANLQPDINWFTPGMLDYLRTQADQTPTPSDEPVDYWPDEPEATTADSGDSGDDTD